MPWLMEPYYIVFLLVFFFLAQPFRKRQVTIYKHYIAIYIRFSKCYLNKWCQDSGAAIKFLYDWERSQPQPQGPQARGAVDYNVRVGSPGAAAEPPETFLLPRPKFVGWGRILNPICTKVLTRTLQWAFNTHTHTHTERERKREVNQQSLVK